MALTDLQKERIKFHLDFQRGVDDLLTIDFNVNLATLTPTEERNLVGTITGLAVGDATARSFDNEVIATVESVLGQCEFAYERLGVDNIDPSQFVLQAGKVKLNPSEYKLRELFYKQKIKFLEKALGYAEGIFQASQGGPRL